MINLTEGTTLFLGGGVQNSQISLDVISVSRPRRKVRKAIHSLGELKAVELVLVANHAGGGGTGRSDRIGDARQDGSPILCIKRVT